MDHVLNDRLRGTELDVLAAALSNGLILVSANGEIVWMDEKTRRRVNGRLQSLDLPIRRSDSYCVDCFIAAVQVTINGKPLMVCAIQQTKGQKELDPDVIAVIESVIADASRAIAEKLGALHQATRSHPPSADLELLTQREREVLALICEGRTDADMSLALGLSPNTVRNHIASLFRKIGVNRRSAAIIWARERAITGRDAFPEKRSKRPDSKDRKAVY
ncbi:MAG TPA: LuxR C-terminal-related transcriptional regulator [Bradyrhizobium sp.]|nr:LuxR C-terminal-related transcriptional regulator [Bradyrhizobium sp.]